MSDFNPHGGKYLHCKRNSFCTWSSWPYAAYVSSSVGRRPISEVSPGPGYFRCAFGDGTTVQIPAFLGRFLRPCDGLAFLSPANTEVLIRRQPPRARPQEFLFATIGYVAQPKASNSAGHLVRAELPKCSGKPESLFLSASALRRYFYQFDGETRRL